MHRSPSFSGSAIPSRVPNLNQNEKRSLNALLAITTLSGDTYRGYVQTRDGFMRNKPGVLPAVDVLNNLIGRLNKHALLPDWLHEPLPGCCRIWPHDASSLNYSKLLSTLVAVPLVGAIAMALNDSYHCPPTNTNKSIPMQ
ncbi:MAG: hypothetical protein V3T17_13235 [Pseudomonadales bacterium]